MEFLTEAHTPPFSPQQQQQPFQQQQNTLVAPPIQRTQRTTSVAKIKAQPKKMRVEKTKLSTIQIAILSAILFFIFANPEVFTIMNRVLPGIILDYAGKIKQQGAVIHSILFGLVFYGVVYFIQRPTFEY
jgi:hypothetical protein